MDADKAEDAYIHIKDHCLRICSKSAHLLSKHTYLLNTRSQSSSPDLRGPALCTVTDPYEVLLARLVARRYM